MSDEKEVRKRKRKHAGSKKPDSNDDNNDGNDKANKEKVIFPSNGGAEAFNNSCTLYIEGLPFAATDANVIDFFASVGVVQSVRLPKWNDTGRLRGYGHVEFATSEVATEALTLDGCDMMGRYIKVARPMTPRIFQESEVDKSTIVKPVGCKSVFVKNIPYDTNEDEVKEIFKVCGPIVNVRLASWGHTSKLKGFGYVDFQREDSAEIAVKKSCSASLMIRGRPVVIDFETGAPKRGFKQNR